MFDRFLVPFYLFWPIALTSFILIFFLPITMNIKFINDEYNISSSSLIYNQTSNFSFNHINKNNDNIIQRCKNIISEIKKEYEIKLIKRFNLYIKIIIIILFVLTCLSVILVFLMIKCDACYDEDFGGYCQTLESALSFSHEDKIARQPFYVILIWIIICLSIIIISSLSIKYSYNVKNKIEKYCINNYGKIYDFKNFKLSRNLLIVIIILFSIEVILCIYSIIFAIIAFANEDNSIKNKSKTETNININNK